MDHYGNLRLNFASCLFLVWFVFVEIAAAEVVNGLEAEAAEAAVEAAFHHQRPQQPLRQTHRRS